MLNVEEWMRSGACADAPDEIRDLFTADPRPSERYMTLAAALCADCAVAEDCAAYAIQNEIAWGLWAGHWYDGRRRAVAA